MNFWGGKKPVPPTPADLEAAKARAAACMAEINAALQRHDCQVNVLETYRDGVLVGRQLEVNPNAAKA